MPNRRGRTAAKTAAASARPASSMRADPFRRRVSDGSVSAAGCHERERCLVLTGAHLPGRPGGRRTGGSDMKVVVIGGTGLIGTNVVARLGEHGHEAVAAAPSTGVNTLTGEGLAEVLDGAAVVVDVSNSPSFADDPVMEFFRTSTTNLLRYSAEAGVGHYVALSV